MKKDEIEFIKRNYDAGPLARSGALREALVAFIEMHAQAPSDFCGEQREWYLPRFQKMFPIMAKLFPVVMVEAMQEAMTPYGDKLVPVDNADNDKRGGK